MQAMGIGVRCSRKISATCLDIKHSIVGEGAESKSSLKSDLGFFFFDNLELEKLKEPRGGGGVAVLPNCPDLLIN